MSTDQPIPEIDPQEFLSALLAITPEDAKDVRDAATEKARDPDEEVARSEEESTS